MVYETVEVEDSSTTTTQLLSTAPHEQSKSKTTQKTGKTETNGDYIRHEYYYSDKSTYWGQWQKQASSTENLWSTLGSLLGSILLLLIAIPVIIYAWRFLLLGLLGFGLLYLYSVVRFALAAIAKWIFNLIGLALLTLLLVGIFQLFKQSPQTNPPVNPILVEDDVETKPAIESIDGDSIIAHHRVWQDYEGVIYSGDIKVRVSDYQESQAFRNGLEYNLFTTVSYNDLVNSLFQNDRGRMNLLYEMLDSIKSTNSLGERAFAEVIVSLVQDIPYTLILSEDCNPYLYDDEFITEYLLSDRSCIGNIKFGLLSPIEFNATLSGDCDTRTLLVYTLLSHYGYEVALLSSELYQHSIIGINLDYPGFAKQIGSDRFVVWETTERGYQPGNIPLSISDMKFWNVSLLSKNNYFL